MKSVEFKSSKWTKDGLNGGAILKKRILYSVWYFDGYGLKVTDLKTDRVIANYRADMSYKKLSSVSKKHGLTLNKSLEVEFKLVKGLIPDKRISSIGGAEIYDEEIKMKSYKEVVNESLTGSKGWSGFKKLSKQDLKFLEVLAKHMSAQFKYDKKNQEAMINGEKKLRTAIKKVMELTASGFTFTHY